jgi:aquaporin Z
MRDAFRTHWPEYLLEGLGLGLFMMSAVAFAVLLFHPGSPLGPGDPLMRRVAMGIAMGLTAVALVYSPIGRRSGGHFNPAVTLAFLRLERMERPDAAWYIVFQVMGGITGMVVAAMVFGAPIAHASVNYVVTVPGPAGVGVAFAAEATISSILMTVVLAASNQARLAPFTGVLAGTLVATFIAFEAPLSGMSMNPARTLASAVPAGVWTSAWIYLVAPVCGMLIAVQLYARGQRPVHCAKLYHPRGVRCIFRCDYAEPGKRR